MRRPLSFVLLASLGLGCTYAHDRALDLGQTINLSAGWSEGLEVNLRATKVLQVGAGAYQGKYWAGWKDGVADVWQEERSEIGIGPLYSHEVHRGDASKLLDIHHPFYTEPGFRTWSWDLDHLSDRGFFDLGATVDVALVGLDASFSPVEFVDFVCGLAGADPLQDDVYAPTAETLVARIQVEDARVRAAAARALRLRFGEDFGYRIYTAPKEMPPMQIDAVRRAKRWLADFTPQAPSPDPQGAPLPAETPPAEPAPASP